MREWCLVIDAVSSKAAKQIGDALDDRNLDLDVEAPHARVRCFAQSENAIKRGLRRDPGGAAAGVALGRDDPIRAPAGMERATTPIRRS
jgi:hypothetical protein